MNTANEQTKNSNSDFQNSNLANSGSGKFARDYDKEPLIIKDHSALIIVIQFGLLIFVLVAAQLGILSAFDLKKPLETDDFSFIAIFLIVIPFIRVIERDSPSSKRFIIFNQNSISIEVDNVRIVRINLDQITDISKNADIRNSLPPYFPISKELFYICIFTVTLAMMMLMFNDFIIIAILFIAIFFLPKSIICALQGGICFNRLLYDRLAIYFKDGTIINIFITATQEYLEIKRYFLINKGINISKAKTELIVFSKRKNKLTQSIFP